MSAYLIVIIALLPVAPIIKVVLTGVGVGTKNDEELGVAMIAGSLAIMIICLAFYAFIVLGIFDLLGLLKLFTRDEARRIAANIAKLPELFRKP